MKTIPIGRLFSARGYSNFSTPPPAVPEITAFQTWIAGLFSQTTETGVHSGFQSLVPRNAEEHLREDNSLVLAEGSAQRRLVFPGHSADKIQRRLSCLRQVQRVHTPVFCGRLPLKKAFVLKLIDDGHEPARMHPQVLRQLLLAEPGRLRDLPKNTSVRRRELVGRQPLRKSGGSVGPHLS